MHTSVRQLIAWAQCRYRDSATDLRLTAVIGPSIGEYIDVIKGLCFYYYLFPRFFI